MKKLLLAALAATTLSAGAGVAQDRIQVGRLACDVDPGVGLLIASSKDMTCEFTSEGGRSESYEGTINKFGFDVGITAATHIEWLVFALSDTPVGRNSLAGTYVGGSGEATFGVGLGANWLVGGSRKSFALQPWSIQGQAGVNLSLAFTELTLE